MYGLEQAGCPKVFINRTQYFKKLKSTNAKFARIDQTVLYESSLQAQKINAIWA